jgi:hypothetical protein
VIRYIVVIHYHYDSTEPAEATGDFDGPIPSYESKDEAEKRARIETGPHTTGYVWAVEV